jgi:hypothetical protein
MKEFNMAPEPGGRRGAAGAGGFSPSLFFLHGHLHAVIINREPHIRID